MGALLGKVREFLTSDDWPIADETDTSIRTGFTGTNGSFGLVAYAREDYAQVVFYGLYPVQVPEDRRQAVAEFITRVNYGLVIGNFEMDFSDGEVRYKTSVDVEDTELTPALIKHLIYGNIHTADRYFPGLMQVVYSGVSPAAAVQSVEGGGAEA